ncbi:MAG: hypothetical protein MUC50_16620 [Myxococcota bacterium]|jgi:hypothetical protein|nr:hypothetical protein [Myxococcota bacterium]
MKRQLLWLACGAACWGCLHASSGGEVVVSTGPVQTDSAPPPKKLADQIAADERLAAQILSEFLVSDDTTIAGWAAVHGLRLGLKQDEGKRREALKKCLKATDVDPLLHACCWRWASVLDEATQSKLPIPVEPTARVIAALSLNAKTKNAQALLGLLALPQGAAPKAPTRLAAQILAPYVTATAPFDDGPIALAMAFLEARKALWKDAQDEGGKALLATKLRAALAERMKRTLKWANLDAIPPSAVETSQLEIGLVSTMASQPSEVLRAVAMTGSEPNLRQEALRALASSAMQPTVMDLAAAAAGLRAQQARTQLEAARTFLLLSIRAHSR